MRIANVSFVVSFGSLVMLASATSLAAQAPAQAQAQLPPPLPQITADPPILLVPATKMEGFVAAPGSIVTVAFDDVGVDLSGSNVLPQVSVQAREMRDESGSVARGLVITAVDGSPRPERSFVDVEEIPELMRGLDSLLQVISNPTQFEHFEMRYATRGELSLSVVGTGKGTGTVRYAVETGRAARSRVTLDSKQMAILRTLLQTAQQKLKQVGGEH